MPCYDHRNEPAYVRAEVEAKMQTRIDELANWLCICLGALEELGIEPRDPGMRDWWETHKAWDNARKEAKNDQI